MSKLFYVGSWLVGQIVGVILVFFAWFISEGYELEIKIVGLALVLCSWFVMARLVYKVWDSIQDGHARMKPAVAATLMAIPFINILSSVLTLSWLVEDYNLYLRRHSMNVENISGVSFKVFGVSLICNLIPGVNILSGIVGLIASISVIGNMCDAIDALHVSNNSSPAQVSDIA